MDKICIMKKKREAAKVAKAIAQRPFIA